MTPNVTALQQQLKQLKARHAAGKIDQAQFDKERTALERRLLDQLDDAPAAAPVRRAGFQTWALLSVVIAVVAVAGYGVTGAPDRINAPPAAPAAAEGEGGHDMGSEQMAELVGRLAERMKANPNDAEGWTMLGRSYAAMGRNDDAVQALAQAAKLMPNDAGALADLADALAVKNGRTLDGEPTQLVEKALKNNPDHLKALALAGTAAFNRGDYAKAVEYWDHAIAVGPADSPMVQMATNGAAEARSRGKLPPAAPTAAMPGAATAAAAAQPAASAVVSSGVVSGTVALSPELQSKVSPEDAVFVFARAPSGSRMPLALLRKQVKDLPFSFTLDDNLAMSPTARLSLYEKVVVGARVSKGGQPMPQSGDLEGVSDALAVGAKDLRIVITAPIK